jgi:hypothetical protein
MRSEMEKNYTVTDNPEYRVHEGRKLIDLSVSDTVLSTSIRGIAGGTDEIREVSAPKDQ